MKTFLKRLDNLEQHKKFQEFLEREAEFERHSKEELTFFSLHGYWPEAPVTELPPKQEHVLYGMRTTVLTEWLSEHH